MNITTGPPLGLAFFFFNDTATTEIYTLSLHDALPIYSPSPRFVRPELDSSAQARFALGRLVFFELNPEFAPRRCWRSSPRQPAPPSLLPEIHAASNALSLIHRPSMPPPESQRLPFAYMIRTFSSLH